MKISSARLLGFRNFKDATININMSTLVIGANDIGKTNFIYALRLLLDKSLSESDLEPRETDFHVSGGKVYEDIEITVHFDEVKEDAALSVLKGAVSDSGNSCMRYIANRKDMDYQIFIGFDEENLFPVDSRFYLKFINLKYVDSQRDLNKFIQKEKRHLLSLAQKSLSKDEMEEDQELLEEIGTDLTSLNEKISQLYYVSKSTDELNVEIKKLSQHNSNFDVQLDSGAISVNDFIERLKLSANSDGSPLLLGGDGRNNQILIALWKARSLREHDLEREVVFYVVEEPEAHLHPHQQRKLADYLVDELPGQSIITSHSPQIAVSFSPDSIVRLVSENNETIAASNGCSECIDHSIDNFGYRMSIIPAETFFSCGVFLVEGPSERLFYEALAKALNIDLDYLNISILSVDGIDFKTYIDVLNALKIPWVLRTDNDVFKVNKKHEWRLAGINRCLRIAGLPEYENEKDKWTPQDAVDWGTWEEASAKVNKLGMFISKIDLEHDLVHELSDETMNYSQAESAEKAIAYLQSKKAIRMRELIVHSKNSLDSLKDGELARPLKFLVELISK